MTKLKYTPVPHSQKAFLAKARGNKRGRESFLCNRALGKLTLTFRFSCRVSRAAARNNSEDPRFCPLQRSELLRQDQG